MKEKNHEDGNFSRTGPLMDLNSYPSWAQEMVNSTLKEKKMVVNHELFSMMKEASLPYKASYNFFVGGWPTIEQFPQYMATNLCKIQFGRSHGENMARKYLMKNIRVEQNHADHWIAWAVASGITKNELFCGNVPIESQALNHWCWHSCARDSLATSMAATNLAIEGATGEWSALICSSFVYESIFEENERQKAMRWLKLHASYDDTHPWEALEIICALIGDNAESKYVTLLERCIKNSYEYMVLSLDHCLMEND